MKWIMLLLTLGAGAAVASCPDYFNVEMRGSTAPSATASAS